MNKFFDLYFETFYITIPLTIYLIVLINRGVKELLDFFFNRKSVKKLIFQADNISFVEIENEIELYTEKIQSKYPWTKEHFDGFLKKKELKTQLIKQRYKREKVKINLEIEKIEKSIRQYEIVYWISEFGFQKSESELEREMKLRKIFNPE
ncbi:MAG: hypothetical protein IEMM0006_0835 [bacterium]|nr:MAG: hypothetical protein IEMM0006_0835 [bacterium]